MRYSTWSLGYVQDKCSESRSVLSGRYSFVSSFSRTRGYKIKTEVYDRAEEWLYGKASNMWRFESSSRDISIRSVQRSA